MAGVFEDMMNAIQVEHGVQETDFRHKYRDDVILKANEPKSSPYMVVKSENDQISTGPRVYHFFNGKSQDESEQ